MSSKANKKAKKMRKPKSKIRNKSGADKAPASMGQPSKKKSKMRKRIFSVAKNLDAKSGSLHNKSSSKDTVKGGDTVPKEVRPTVTKVRVSKEQVSSNWAAFKESGLHLIKSKPKPKSSSDYKGVFRKKRKMLSNGGTSQQTVSEETEGNTVGSLDIEDTYVKDLVPPDEKSLKELTKCVAIDCEMVGVGDGKENALARVSLVNQHGACVYDKFVKPKEDVADYRTKVSGVRPGDLALGEDLEVVQKDVAKIVEGRILVGHAISHDLKVLFLSHPPHMIRDTSKFKPFRDMFDGRNPALRKLADKVLGVKIQDGEHSSVEDAKATMQLYNLYQKEWEEHRKLKALAKREKMLKIMEAQKLGKKDKPGEKADFPTVHEVRIGKHNKIQLKKGAKPEAQKTISVSDMFDEYVAF